LHPHSIIQVRQRLAKCYIQGDLDVNVLGVLVIPIAPVVLILLILFNPAEMNDVDRQMLDFFLVKELNNLETNVSQIAML
jgi:hypothetical protein